MRSPVIPTGMGDLFPRFWRAETAGAAAWAGASALERDLPARASGVLRRVDAAARQRHRHAAHAAQLAARLPVRLDAQRPAARRERRPLAADAPLQLEPLGELARDERVQGQRARLV